MDATWWQCLPADISAAHLRLLRLAGVRGIVLGCSVVVGAKIHACATATILQCFAASAAAVFICCWAVLCGCCLPALSIITATVILRCHDVQNGSRGAGTQGSSNTKLTILSRKCAMQTITPAEVGVCLCEHPVLLLFPAALTAAYQPCANFAPLHLVLPCSRSGLWPASHEYCLCGKKHLYGCVRDGDADIQSLCFRSSLCLHPRRPFMNHTHVPPSPQRMQRIAAAALQGFSPPEAHMLATLCRCRHPAPCLG